MKRLVKKLAGRLTACFTESRIYKEHQTAKAWRQIRRSINARRERLGLEGHGRGWRGSVR